MPSFSCRRGLRYDNGGGGALRVAIPPVSQLSRRNKHYPRILPTPTQVNSSQFRDPGKRFTLEEIIFRCVIPVVLVQ